MGAPSFKLTNYDLDQRTTPSPANEHGSLSRLEAQNKSEVCGARFAGAIRQTIGNLWN